MSFGGLWDGFMVEFNGEVLWWLFEMVVCSRGGL